MIADVIETFKKSLQDLDWMDKESAAAAARKVRHHPSVMR